MSYYLLQLVHSRGCAQKAIWEFESLHRGNLPDGTNRVAELESIANSLLTSADVSKQVLTAIPYDLVEYVYSHQPPSSANLRRYFRTMTTTATHEFSPVCAVVGVMLAQDILKALAAREPPIANFFTFDGNTGGGTVCRMNMP